jgi:hypothetical protein
LIDGSYEYYHYLHGGIDDNVMSCWLQPTNLSFKLLLQCFLRSFVGLYGNFLPQTS